MIGAVQQGTGAQRLAYLNGQFVPEREARISIFDSALMYGDMVFEMTRTFRQEPFLLDRHLDRLYDSIRYARIDCGLSQEQMLAATRQTIDRNRDALGGYDFQIMHNVTRGGMDLYAELVREGTAPVVTINVMPLIRHVGRSADAYERGAHFVTTTQRSVPARYIDPKAKNRSRIYYKLAELEAARLEPGAMALLTDERGFVTEGTGNNFFMVRGGRILTPKPHDILRGVSRGYCMELAGAAGVPVEEADIEPYDVRQASEAWYTSTSIAMIPVTRFNGAPVGAGAPGSVYRRLLRAWSASVGVDIPEQARRYAELAAGWRP